MEGIFVPRRDRFFHRRVAFIIGRDEVTGHIRVVPVRNGQIPAVHRVIYALAVQLLHRDILLDVGVITGDDDKIPSAKIVLRQIVRYRKARLQFRRFGFGLRFPIGRGCRSRIGTRIRFGFLPAGSKSGSKHCDKQQPGYLFFHDSHSLSRFSCFQSAALRYNYNCRYTS